MQHRFRYCRNLKTGKPARIQHAACPVGFADSTPWDCRAMAHAQRKLFGTQEATMLPIAGSKAA
jgi:hypothetical protein